MSDFYEPYIINTGNPPTSFPRIIHWSFDPIHGGCYRTFGAMQWHDTNSEGFIIESGSYPEALGHYVRYFVDEMKNYTVLQMVFRRGRMVHRFSRHAEFAPTVVVKLNGPSAESARLPGMIWVGE